ncbi:MAG: hypothetical protein H7831_18215 [Magnetococcus sp. WYHC-3]
MVDIIKRLFRPAPLAQPAAVRVRTLEHPRHLVKGDALVLADLPHIELPGRRFDVTSVNTYVLAGQPCPELNLRAEHNEVARLKPAPFPPPRDAVSFDFSRRLRRREVMALFDLEDFSRLFEDKVHPFILPARPPSTETPLPWLSREYHLEVDALKAIFHHGDYRGHLLPTPEQGEGLDFYRLTGQDHATFLEIEVFDNGDTEVFIGLRLPPAVVVRLEPRR